MPSASHCDVDPIFRGLLSPAAPSPKQRDVGCTLFGSFISIGPSRPGPTSPRLSDRSRSGPTQPDPAKPTQHDAFQPGQQAQVEQPVGTEQTHLKFEQYEQAKELHVLQVLKTPDLLRKQIQVLNQELMLVGWIHVKKQPLKSHATVSEIKFFFLGMLDMSSLRCDLKVVSSEN